MKKLTKISFLLLLSLSLVLTGCGVDREDGGGESGAGEQTPNENEATPGAGQTITFGVTPWTSTIPPTYIAKAILEDMGYEVVLQDAEVGVVYTGLSQGEIDVFMDAWLPDMHRSYIESYGENLDVVSVSYEEGELGWVVPTYVEEIDSIEDIKGNEDIFGGSIYGIEEGAGMSEQSREMLKAYDLDLEYVASSEPGMLSQAKKAIDAQEPVLFLGWRPHPMFVNWDLKVLEDPQAFYETSEVRVITRSGLDETSPEAHQFFSNWEIPIEDVENMIAEIENNNTPPEEAARDWIENNQDKVSEMTGTAQEE
ncbi:glycine betaine ABC transporter substrate-binding protein [Caldalkalibacillus salinus]|uniref:glycine betaine ABC transporter substrate-binding protein n=1 Tax=Caldalkalibacillus salinus TaxID=2803787 RepID=UPI001923C254|nr:glycine betaine ABC transporter substrate-binding protein [Caldalkalibacillus salinus]